ncbi:hypothetical protein WA158_000517 [Blastocystis sp. Blastoise]
MKFFCLVLLAAVASAVWQPWIWPLPQEYLNGTESYIVNHKNLKLSGDDLSEDLTDGFKRFYDLTFDHSTVEAPEGSIIEVHVAVEDLKAALKLGVDESYTLTVSGAKEPVEITAKTVYGAYHAFETLSQMITYDYYQKLFVIANAPWKISDSPRFSHRGVLMDTSRHYESVPSLKKLIDSFTYAKINVLHWHITDSQSQPSESETFPHFWDGAYSEYEKYTIQDMKDIVEYGRKRGVRVVPEMDVPGHESSWCTGIPEACPSQTCREPLDPSSEVTWEAISSILGEWSGKSVDQGIFPDEYYHLGGDEVDTGCWSRTDRIVEWMNKNNFTAHDTYKYFVNRAHEIVLGYERHGIFWEEVWNNFRTALDKKSIIETWMNKKTANDVVANGYRCIISDPTIYLDHLDVSWESMYHDEPFEFIDKQEEQDLIMGGEACMWSETVDVSDLLQTVWPKAAAFAERYWSARDVTNLEDAKPRYMNFRCLLNRRGIQAAPSLNARARSAPGNPGGCYTQ